MPDADLSAVRLLPADHGRRARAPRYVGHAVVVTDEAVSDDRLIVREARERPEGRNCQCGRMPSGLRHEPSYLNEADAPDLPVQLADQLAHLGIEGVSWGNPSPLNQQHAEFSGGPRVRVPSAPPVKCLGNRGLTVRQAFSTAKSAAKSEEVAGPVGPGVFRLLLAGLVPCFPASCIERSAGSRTLSSGVAGAASESGMPDAHAGARMALRMAATSGASAPSVHAAYIVSIVSTLCPCCFATHSGLRPVMRFQPTDECRAA
jgi:hypothetical protein